MITCMYLLALGAFFVAISVFLAYTGSYGRVSRQTMDRIAVATVIVALLTLIDALYIITWFLYYIVR